MSDNQAKFSWSAATLAVTTTILGAPIIFGATEPWVSPLLERNYGHEFRDLYKLAWGIATAALVLFPSYAFFKLALTLLASAVLYKLL